MAQKKVKKTSTKSRKSLDTRTPKLYTRLGWKLCQRQFGCRALQSATRLGKVVNYAVGKSTRRPAGCGPLAVFKTKRDALRTANNWNFRDWSDVYVLCRVEYVPSKEEGLWKDKDVYAYTAVPNGTAYADSVKVIRIEKG